MSAATYSCELAFVGDAVRPDVTVEVVDGWIGEITVDRPAPPEATRLAGLTLPGFANTHSHAFQRALRGRTQAGHGSFWTWRDTMYRAAARLDPDRYHRLARAVFAEMALAGIATVGEFHYVHHRPDGGPYDDPNAMGGALLAAAAEVGIRITLLDTLYLHGGLSDDGYVPLAGCQRRFGDRDAAAWAERVDALRAGPTQRVGAAIHSVRAVDPAAILAVAEWADGDAPLHAHVSEQPAEQEQCRSYHGVSPVVLLREHGAVGPRFTGVHGTYVDDADVASLAAAGAAVCLCPTTERDLGDGIAPTRELATADVKICLGTDSHATIDMFDEARSVELHERLASQHRGTHTATALLAMATHAGHRSLGWNDAGAIEPGHRADLVTVRLDSVRTAGATAETAIEAAVFAAAASDITHVVVDGEAIVADGAHRSIDVAAELDATIKDLLSDD